MLTIRGVTESGDVCEKLISLKITQYPHLTHSTIPEYYDITNINIQFLHDFSKLLYSALCTHVIKGCFAGCDGISGFTVCLQTIQQKSR